MATKEMSFWTAKGSIGQSKGTARLSKWSVVNLVKSEACLHNDCVDRNFDYSLYM